MILNFLRLQDVEREELPSTKSLGKNHTKKPTVGFLVFGTCGKIFNVKVEMHTECVERKPVASRPGLNRPPSFSSSARQVDSKRTTARATDRISEHSRPFRPFASLPAAIVYFLKLQKQLLQVVDFLDIFRYFHMTFQYCHAPHPTICSAKIDFPHTPTSG